jgi:hypothetical protein
LWSLSERDAKVLLFPAFSSTIPKKITQNHQPLAIQSITIENKSTPQQRTIPVTQKTVPIPHRMLINIPPSTPTERRNQHQQRGFGLMKVRNQPINNPKFKTLYNKYLRFTPQYPTQITHLFA